MVHVQINLVMEYLQELSHETMHQLVVELVQMMFQYYRHQLLFHHHRNGVDSTTSLPRSTPTVDNETPLSILAVASLKSLSGVGNKHTEICLAEILLIKTIVSALVISITDAPIVAQKYRICLPIIKSIIAVTRPAQLKTTMTEKNKGLVLLILLSFVL